VKEYKDMTREELLRAVELHRASANTAWHIVEALTEEKAKAAAVTRSRLAARPPKQTG
jgi:hypothetical protein